MANLGDKDTNISSNLPIYKTGIFTLTDASGAGLTISVEDSIYTINGNIVVFSVRVTYPTNTNNLQAALTGFAYPIYQQGVYPPAFLFPVIISPDSMPTYSALPFNSGMDVIFVETDDTQSAITNMQLSDQTVVISGTYITQN